MKIRITVIPLRKGAEEWTEDYDKLGIGDNGNQAQAEDWAHELVERFNAGCRPGEAHRKLLKTEILGASTEHVWVKRTDGMSVEFRGTIVDVFHCSGCGITGKRFRITSNVKRDSKYRAKKYKQCGGSYVND